MGFDVLLVRCVVEDEASDEGGIGGDDVGENRGAFRRRHATFIEEE